jgi:hypothetical protein
VRDRGPEQRGVAHGCEVDEDGAVAQLGAERGRGGEREARLTRTARPGERYEPHLFAAQQPGDRCDLEMASDQRGRRRREGDARRRRRLGRGEGSVVAEDRALKLLELCAGIDTQLLDEHVPCGAIGLERLLLPAGPVESEHLLGPEALAVRLLRDQAFELRQELVVPAERQLRIVQQLPDVQPPFLESRRLGRGHGLTAQVREG